MKKIYILTALFACVPLAAETNQVAPIDINSPALHFVDGTPFIKINLMIYFARLLHKMQEDGRLVHENHELVIQWQNKTCGLKVLAQLEKESPEINLTKVLDHALTIFDEISAPYLEEIRSAKQYMVLLIKQWSVQRQRSHSLLLNWASIEGHNEHAEFRKVVTTITQLDEFCDDLILFLRDLMHTCKLSRQQFMAAIEKQKNTNATR